MKSETIEKLLSITKELLPREDYALLDRKRLEEICEQTKGQLYRDREFTVRFSPEDALRLHEAHHAVKAELELDQIQRAIK